MENKIILELIKKDLDELIMLVDNLEKEENLQQLLIDITTTKARTLLQEFELLKADEIKVKAKPTVEKVLVADEEVEEKKVEVFPEKVPVVETVEAEVKVKESQSPVDVVVNDPVEKESIDIQEEPTVVDNETEENIEPQSQQTEKISGVEQNTIVEPEPKRVDPIIEEPKVEAITEDAEIEVEMESVENEVLAEPKEMEEEVVAAQEPVAPVDEEVVADDSPKVLGEQFTKEPSLHDRLASANSVESKIKGKPVTNLKTAIGLNDRFLYTRELFDNTANKFNAAVETLDGCADLNQAVEYLEQNYQWQKNETSLKFMDLIKRRFDN